MSELILITGRVHGRDCEPLPSALLDIWHADWSAERDAQYDDEGWNLRGKLIADAAGRYELKTIIPGNYLDRDEYRPAHLHVKVSAEHHRVLTTQLFFEGDPYNEKDEFIELPLIMKPRRLADGSQRASFDFVLRRMA